MTNINVLDSKGFIFHIDMSLYSRSAVLKVLNRWTHIYSICLTKCDHDVLDIELALLSNSKRDFSSDAESILNALMHEMLRIEVISQTSSIRELLVGRALYATCIELDKSDDNIIHTSDQSLSWKEDRRRILSSWNSEESK